MSNLQSQARSYKADVLRLKELLDALRAAIAAVLSANPTIDQISKFLGVKWSTAQRFWVEKISGGPVMITAIQAKIGQHHICTEVLDLIESLPDTYKSLIPYQVGAIELTFDIYDAFNVASQQAGVKSRDQMTGEQFATFFGKHHAFVHAVTMRNRQVLSEYSTELDREIRTVLSANDWTTVRPGKSKGSKPPPGKSVQLRKLIDEIRPRFPSEWAMLKALPAHGDSLNNALAGRGKPQVLDELLRRAQRLEAKTRTTRPEPIAEPTATVSEKFEVRDTQQFVGSFVSQVRASVRMFEAAGIDPNSFTDGDRDGLLTIMAKLAKLAGIDESVLKRLQSGEGLSADDPSLRAVFSALGGAKR